MYALGACWQGHRNRSWHLNPYSVGLSRHEGPELKLSYHNGYIVIKNGDFPNIIT